MFSIYDFEGKEKMDAYNIGDALRALDLKPSQKVVESNGGTKKKGEKSLKFEEFLPIFGKVKQDKDIGNFHDFMEVLKLYDKESNGTIIMAELTHLLQSMGEVMTKEEVDQLVKDCIESDEEGFMSYQKFLKALMAGPFPEENE